jgi:hypothetical protein
MPAHAAPSPSPLIRDQNLACTPSARIIPNRKCLLQCLLAFFPYLLLVLANKVPVVCVHETHWWLYVRTNRAIIMRKGQMLRGPSRSKTFLGSFETSSSISDTPSAPPFSHLTR